MTTVADRFVIGERLGAGVWFEVFSCVDTMTGDRVVFKQARDGLAADAVARRDLLELLRRLARCRSRALTAILGYGTRPDGSVWKVEELVLGRTLLAWIADGWAVAPISVQLVARMLVALREVHAAGLVHGCLDPSVLRVDLTLRPRMGECGMATVGRSLTLPLRQPDSGLREEYYAPEVRTGCRPTAASDVYSVGAILNRMMSMNVTGPSWTQAARMGIDHSTLVTVSERARQPDAADRFATVAQMLDAFLAAVPAEVARVWSSE